MGNNVCASFNVLLTFCDFPELLLGVGAVVLIRVVLQGQLPEGLLDVLLAGLLVQAKHLELEDKSARLEAELREHLMLDSRSPESVLREGEILKELLEISEQREKLQAMLEKDKVRYQKEDRDIEAQMLAQGLRPTPVRIPGQ